MVINYDYSLQDPVTLEPTASTDAITSAQLGSNFLFDRDKLGSQNDYETIVENVGIEYIRYPGGSVTEDRFDIASPNSTTSGGKTLTPLSDFLTYANDTGKKVIIVIPTYKYFDQVTRLIDPNAESEIKTFVRKLLKDVYGDADIAGIEIGNEWFQTRFGWTVEEFANLQVEIARWIDQTLNEAAVINSLAADGQQAPKIYAQAGKTDPVYDSSGNLLADDQNEILANAFVSDFDKIDGVLKDFYATNSQGNPLQIGSGVNNGLNSIIEHWQTEANNLDIRVPEWNVGENGLGDTPISGLMRNAPLMRIYAELIANEVDVATFWTVQSKGSATLSSKEGGGTDLSPTGYLYRMLNENLVGLSLDVEVLNSNQVGNFGLKNFHLEDVAGSGPDANIFIFKDVSDGDGILNTAGERAVVYLSSGVDSNLQFALDFSELIPNGAHIHATVLGVAPQSTSTDYDAVGQIRALTKADMGGANDVLTFQLNPWAPLSIAPALSAL